MEQRTPEEIGQTLQNLRKENNLSAAALAELVGVSEGTIHNLEKGKSIPVVTFIRVCKALNVENPDDFLFV